MLQEVLSYPAVHGRTRSFQVRYRQQIKKFVAKVVRDCMDKRKAANWIAKMAGKEIPINDKARFVEVVETELINLHEGNFMRTNCVPPNSRLEKYGL